MIAVKIYFYLVSCPIEFCHSFNLRKEDAVPILKTMSDLIKGCNNASISILSYNRNDCRQRLLTINVVNDEVGAEVVEDLSVKPWSVGNDQGNIVCSEN